MIANYVYFEKCKLTPRASDWGYAGRKIGIRQRLESLEAALLLTPPALNALVRQLALGIRSIFAQLDIA